MLSVRVGSINVNIFSNGNTYNIIHLFYKMYLVHSANLSVLKAETVYVLSSIRRYDKISTIYTKNLHFFQTMNVITFDFSAVL